jgi:hypothetical protein
MNWTPRVFYLPGENTAAFMQTEVAMPFANMLGEINRTLTEQHKSAIDNYRNSSASRHAILNKLLPVWRKVQKSLNDISKAIAGLNQRAKSIDRYMDEYDQIRQQTDKAARMLSSSSLTQFFISGLVLTIAFGGALINFNLIALPMSEMVGGAMKWKKAAETGDESMTWKTWITFFQIRSQYPCRPNVATTMAGGKFLE